MSIPRSVNTKRVTYFQYTQYIPFKHIQEKAPTFSPIYYCSFGLLEWAFTNVHDKITTILTLESTAKRMQAILGNFMKIHSITESKVLKYRP